MAVSTEDYSRFGVVCGMGPLPTTRGTVPTRLLGTASPHPCQALWINPACTNRAESATKLVCSPLGGQVGGSEACAAALALVSPPPPLHSSHPSSASCSFSLGLMQAAASAQPPDFGAAGQWWGCTGACPQPSHPSTASSDPWGLRWPEAAQQQQPWRLSHPARGWPPTPAPPRPCASASTAQGWHGLLWLLWCTCIP